MSKMVKQSMAQKGLSRPAHELTPMHQGMGRVLELQKKFNAAKGINAPGPNVGYNKGTTPVKVSVNKGSKGSRKVGFPSGS